ncbi:NUDIX domain-containing protein [Mucilaginibacter roseus]|uniref:NUDIX domain-containing protein n=1 Tax=Mucilaginibacter roseus TaxID=1528868 RepID=A0ABS8TZ01_9SPHI|nr:NUDIX domain-containing protein [Mucilaginibacter roseus]MCD8739212.1 NUDIX domain-containing protein [Mucilaginibacter roseus]
MPQQSAGILLYKMLNNEPMIFLVHPGGPFWKNKDKGAWSIPKGELDPDEDTLMAAQREFEEETGQKIHGEFTPLPPVKQRSGKIVNAWAVEGDVDVNNIVSNTFALPWPPKSSKTIIIPEVDKGDFFTVDDARVYINPGQIPLIDALLEILAGNNQPD